MISSEEHHAIFFRDKGTAHNPRRISVSTQLEQYKWGMKRERVQRDDCRSNLEFNLDLTS